jgi:von Willebrand factor type A C-terminal domain/von Willebrand factor type A domain
MTITFNAEVFQNPYLPHGETNVNAIMTVTAAGMAAAAAAAANPAAANPTTSSSNGKLFGMIIDISGSMQGKKITAAKDALCQMIDLIPEDAHFFIVAGNDRARLVVPVVPATANNRTGAKTAVKAIAAGGATVISGWLNAALNEFAKMPNAMRQALLMTDGQNDGTDVNNLITTLDRCEGVFQCDCRGVGTDWKVKQLQAIGDKLLGTTDIIADAADIAADFQAILSQAMDKQVSDVNLRLWTPQGAQILYCKQVSPDITDLTQRGKAVKPQVMDYPTGAWGGQESRDYHFCIRIPAGEVGDEILAGRASLICTIDGVETKITEARILATWTDDEAKSTKIDRRVAHYTGQAELAQVIQEGIEARDQGMIDIATAKLGRAVQIAHDSGNEGTAKLLRKVVEIEDASTGTVRLKREVAKEDAMALETRSTKTTRIRKDS